MLLLYQGWQVAQTAVDFVSKSCRSFGFNRRWLHLGFMVGGVERGQVFFLSLIRFIPANHDSTHPLVCATLCDLHVWPALSRYGMLMTFQLTIEEFNSKWWLGTRHGEFFMAVKCARIDVLIWESLRQCEKLNVCLGGWRCRERYCWGCEAMCQRLTTFRLQQAISYKVVTIVE